MLAVVQMDRPEGLQSTAGTVCSTVAARNGDAESHRTRNGCQYVIK